MSAKALSEFMSELAPMIIKNYPDIKWSDGKSLSLDNDLKRAGLAVTYSSGSAVDAILRGVPVISCDSGCLAHTVSSHHLDDIDDLRPPDPRDVAKWIDQLCMSQWTAPEMRQGKVWQFYQPVIEEILSS
jgi:hypothetical protein